MGEIGCLGGEIKISAPEKEVNSEIWGKGGCHIWEKWVSGWRNKSLCSGKRSQFGDMGKRGVRHMGEMGVWVKTSKYLVCGGIGELLPHAVPRRAAVERCLGEGVRHNTRRPRL